MQTTPWHYLVAVIVLASAAGCAKPQNDIDANDAPTEKCCAAVIPPPNTHQPTL